MGKTLSTLLFLIVVICTISSCRADRVAIHGRRGKVRHMRSRSHTPWYTPDGSGYSRHTNRRLGRWDRNLHK